jgi:hypothetical protein
VHGSPLAAADDAFLMDSAGYFGALAAFLR